MKKKSLENLVRKGDTKKAIEILQTLISDLHNISEHKLTNLQSRLRRDKDGTNTEEFTSIENNRINGSFLHILGEVR